MENRNRLLLCIAFVLVVFVVSYHFCNWQNFTMRAAVISEVKTKQQTKFSVKKKRENLQFWKNDSICNRVHLDNNSMTSENLSYFEISCDKINSECNVRIYAVSWSKARKTVGGDIFLLWAEQQDGDGRTVGDVIDNGNGTYAGLIQFQWRGETVIKVKLGSTLENYCRRKISMVKYGNSVFAIKIPWGVKASFQNDIVEEETRCGIYDNIQGYPKLCNLTHLNDGVPWFCGHPNHPKLHCEDLLEYNAGAFMRLSGDPYANSSEVISNFGHGELKQTVTMKRVTTQHQIQQKMACRTVPKRYSCLSKGGYYLNGKWNIPYCESKISFSEEACRRCLKKIKQLLF